MLYKWHDWYKVFYVGNMEQEKSSKSHHELSWFYFKIWLNFRNTNLVVSLINNFRMGPYIWRTLYTMYSLESLKLYAICEMSFVLYLIKLKLKKNHNKLIMNMNHSVELCSSFSFKMFIRCSINDWLIAWFLLMPYCLLFSHTMAAKVKDNAL